jgi:hypothetical protein
MINPQILSKRIINHALESLDFQWEIKNYFKDTLKELKNGKSTFLLNEGIKSCIRLKFRFD